MLNKELSGITLCFGNTTTSLTAAATTVTVGTAASASVAGTAFTISAAAKTWALVDELGAAVTSAPTLVATATTGQAAIIVHTVDVGGVYKAIKGNTVNISGASDFADELNFPNIPDILVPFAYSTVKNPAGSATATFTFGTTTWNAAGIVTTTTNLAALPARPLASA